MSFFGGGTDYHDFFQEYGGSVISTTFDKYVYVTVRNLPPFFDYRNKLIYSKIEKTNRIEELEHPLVRNAMKYLNMQDLHISYDADLPARSGLGSSSSFAVALLQSLYALKGNYISPEILAKESIFLERNLCNESGGWQDQIAASYGGFNLISFQGSSFEVRPIIISEDKKNRLNDNLMLFFTGFVRYSSEIAKTQINSIGRKKQELQEMLSLVDEAKKILETSKSDIDEFGHLLNHTWKLKRGITNEISSSELDLIYNTAIKAGALGGKLLGAGGGGFFVFYVPKERQNNVKQALQELLYVPFKFESSGSKILYYKPEGYNI